MAGSSTPSIYSPCSIPHRRLKQLHFVIWTLLLLVKHGTCIDEDFTQDFHVEEEHPEVLTVGRIGVGQSWAGQVSPPYFIVSSPDSGIDNKFSIGDQDGLITTKGRLDYETQNQYTFVAISLSGRNVRVNIYVEDVNDHSPSFKEPERMLQLPESAPRDAKYTLGSASDPDRQLNSTQSYEIVEGNINNAFRLETKPRQNDALLFDLAINNDLDFEEVPFYSLVIRAYDGGRPPLYGTMRLNISIIDVNDNQPIFNQSRYFAKIRENATIGTTVLQVQATDRDSGENGKVRYQIDRQRSDQEEHFNINPVSGIISVNKELDYETRSVYEIIVVARDNGTQRLQTTAVVSIQIEDVNDNAPVINIIFLTDDESPTISEKAEPGDFVARISVSDPDVQSYISLVNVTLQGGDGHFGLTTTDNVVYLMILSTPLDFEMKSSYTLTVVATDSGVPPLVATKTFTLKVGDVNDNPPEFTQLSYSAEVQEVLAVGSSVLKVTALDRDVGDNAKVTYSLEPSATSLFSINNISGLITTKSRVSCDTSSQMTFKVIATDSGVPRLSSTATVTVSIKDVNDNQPTFDQTFYNVSVPENKTVNSCILRVSASDPDCGRNGQVTYAIARNLGFDVPLQLSIRNDTGDICITRPLDYETQSSYEFPVLASDYDGLHTTAMVKVVVTDVNDNIPTFYPSQYNASLEEGSSVGQEIVAVHAYDGDSGAYGQVAYSIVSGNAAGYFSINQNTGVISVNKALSNSQRLYTLSIGARDGGGQVAAVNAVVRISILDPSQQPPIFTAPLYQFHIQEGLPIRSVVSQVSATNNNLGAGAISYSIIAGDSNGLFYMDSSTGEIQTRAVLDREATAYILLTVQAQSGSPPSFGRAQVNISIDDVNDNSPTFPVSLLEISVQENLAPNSVVYSVLATDRDSGLNGKVDYSLQNSLGMFSLDSNSGQLRVIASPDYETRQKYEMTVIAKDRGVPPLQSAMQLIVNIQDVNDNAPVFAMPQYNIRVTEGMAVNTNIGKVNATDADSGNNGRISYSLSDGQDAAKFGIFPETGAIYSKVVLDREDQDECILTVIARDNGTPSKSASVLVVVTILDENDNSPKFLEDAYMFQIAENLPVSTEVGVLQAVDPDSTDNQNLMYSLLLPSELFSVNQQTGVLTTKQTLDRETTSKHQLSVKVSDGGTPAGTAIVHVEIQVLDVNDNAPTFDHSGTYTVYVDENQPKGHMVTTITAHDLDEGTNADISYSLKQEGVDYKMFSLHPKTGVLTTQEVLDHEAKSLYRLQVVAVDAGLPAKSSTASVEVHVQDINESGPVFDTATVKFDIRENSAPGTIVGTVKAWDHDSGDNGVINFYIIGGNLFSMFGINRTTGSLYLEQSVDYEVASSYSVIVRAVDNSVINPMSNDINVQINVIDVNDNAPVFDTDPVVVSVDENQPSGMDVYTFKAFDLDGGSAGQVRYSILSQSPPGDWFAIDSSTGKLRVNKALDYEETNLVSLVIEARDQPESGDSLSTTVTAVIMIRDLNDNSPQFVPVRQQVDIVEDEPVGYPIMHIVAWDADSGENGRIIYAIESGNIRNHFHLNPETGLLTIGNKLDRETVESIQLRIVARDHGYPQLSAQIVLSLNIIDVNDNSPHFTQSHYNATVEENQPPGTVVINLLAQDPDRGEFGHLTYMIPSGVADNLFIIDENTGRVFTNTTFDRETTDHLTFTAYVRDGGYPSLYDTATVRVQILDVNDNTPSFMDATYRVEVSENTEVNDIHTVMATDRDKGINALVTYSIIGGNTDGKFSLDGKTGELSCQELDREKQSVYNLTIEGRDGGSPARSATCTIIVQVIDENDNNPTFTQPFYTKSIVENIRPDTSILRVTATDADAGENAMISYSISNEAEGLFKINNQTGEILTAGELDREKKGSYSFQVVASDGGLNGPRQSTIQVDITIEDVNDNAPQFLQIPYRVNISQNHGMAQYILQVSAKDKDLGPNGEVMYNFAAESPYFGIDSFSGVIVPRRELDAGSVKVHRIEVIAVDKGQPPMSSTGIVEIRVGNAAGFATLAFQRDPYEVTLGENSVQGTEVVIVRASNPTGLSSDISYSFASGNEANTFAINPTTGRVTVKDPARLDYELTHQLRLVVAASANSAYGYTTVYVNLQDANDNPPRFMQDRYVSAVWEGSIRGTYVTQISAMDADEGRNARITYNIIGGNVQNAFIIDPPNTGIVKANIILDREIRDSYRLEIEAIDGGVPALSTRCFLKIQVIDDNDNAPFFPQYSPISVPEDKYPGSDVLQVTANDRDLNPVLSYHILEEGNYGNAFNIDRFTGLISIARALDFEETPSYNLAIMASDNKYNVTTSLVINIVDVNDNAPVFSEESYQVTLAELTAPGASVIKLNATDRDSAQNAAITYSMLPVPGFYIDRLTGVIYTNQTVRFTAGQPVTYLVVTAKDSGTPSLSTVIAVRVQVTDVNNNAPILSQASYDVQVSEDERRGHILLHLMATDADDAYENSKIDYLLLAGNEEEKFELNSGTGDLVLVASLDREVQASYKLAVIAKDRGKPSLSSSCQVVITVQDVNDNSPVFSQSSYRSSVAEDVAAGTSVQHVTATDADAGDNGRVVYLIESGNDDNKFEIERETGVISVRASLDYETRKVHRLIVKAMDSSSTHQRSAFTTVVINITDVNEFTPRFPVLIYMEMLLENEAAGAYVFTAHASDKDGGQFGIVTYELLGDQPLFAIERDTGVVTSKQMFDYEASQNEYTFTIRATDTGGRSATVPVMVTIAAVDEFKPRFSKNKYQFDVPGNAERGYKVGQIQAYDDDGGRSGFIRYSLQEENEYFEIIPDTGVILVAKDLQDSNKSRRKRFAGLLMRTRRSLTESNITLTILASSGLSNSLADRTKVEVFINRTCAGCAVMAAVAGGDLSGTPLVLVILFVIVVVVLVVVLIIIYLRSRERKRRPPGGQYEGSFDSMGMPHALPRDLAPPTYNEINQSHYNHRPHDHNVTTSEISDQSHSASSGRGSAEEADEVDEEIRMINAAPLQSKNMRVPQDSGIQQDDDALSEHSVQNHKEYLARLGIDTSKLKTSNMKPPVGSSVESMHQFAEEGGGEGGMESYPQHNIGTVKTAPNSEGTCEFQYTEPNQTQAGSLSSIINSEEELSGSYNWDYLLDWGPQYQPLAHVFSEIAKLKDDSIKPKKNPQVVPHRQNLNINKNYPPPLLTNAPPKVLLAQPVSTRPGGSSSGGSSRTSQLVSLPSMPRSPISHESSFTSPALSPSFTPSLSPLATRSPSISPIVTPKGSNNHLNHRQPADNRTLKHTPSESEQELHI